MNGHSNEHSLQLVAPKPPIPIPEAFLDPWPAQEKSPWILRYGKTCKRSCRPLRAFAISLCGNIDRADDLTQETYSCVRSATSTLVRARNEYGGVALYYLAQSFFRSQYRKRRRGSRGCGWTVCRYLEIAARAKRTRRVRRVSHCTRENFPPTNAKHWILVGASGFTYEDAALIAGCAVGTIKSRMHRARIRLADLTRYRARWR